MFKRRNFHALSERIIEPLNLFRQRLAGFADFLDGGE